MNIYSKLALLSKSKIHFQRYIKLIEHYTHNLVLDGEDHHILPKSIFPENRNTPYNLIKLPIKTHFIAHYLLHRFIGGKMSVAYFMMCNRLDKRNSRAYVASREYQSSIMQSTANPNHDGMQSKIAWANDTKNRRHKQSLICAENNRKYKSKPKELRKYNCSWCSKTLMVQEFIHMNPKNHYYCNASCRNSRTNTIRVLKR